MRTTLVILIGIALISVMVTPAMADLDDLETRCFGVDNCILNGTITDGSVIVLENPGSITNNWTITLPPGDVKVAYVHIWTYGHCDGNPTAEFWNSSGAYESIYFDPNNLPTDRTETRGVWWADFSPSNTHYYWKVNATNGTNIFKGTGCGGPAYDDSWFVAVIDNCTNDDITHTGHWWHNTGYNKTYSNDTTDRTETWFYNDPVGDPLNTDANYSLWTVQTHLWHPPIEFNDETVGLATEGLCEWVVDNVQADGDQLLSFACEDPNCDEYYVYFGTLAEKISSQSPKPDLVVEDIIFPEVMNSSINHTIKARIKNQGDAGTGNTSNVSLNVDTHSYKETGVGPLAAGANTTVSFTNVSLGAGCHKFTVTADCDSNVSESNENNNATSEWYQVDNVIVVHNNSDLIGEADRNESGTYYIENRTITNCAGCGITIENTTLPFVIQNCTVHDCNCKAAAPDPAGIFLHNVTKGTIGNPSNRNTIENNTNAGIRVKNSTYVDITDNTIRNNTLYGIYAYPRALPTTSETRDDCKYINVTNNTVTENGEAVDLIAYNCTVKNNTITDNTKFGIYMMGNYSNIAYNTIQNNSDYGVKLFNSSDNYIYENEFICNNVDYSARTSQGCDNKDNHWNTTAIGNYWTDWDDNTPGTPSTYDIDCDSNKDYKPRGLYVFSVNASGDKWAYGFTVDDKPPSTNNAPDTEFTTAQYTKIEADDGKFQSDQTSGPNPGYAAHRFNFSVEVTSGIDKINVTWNGKGYHGSLDDGAILYIWNFTSGNYTLLQASANTEDEVYLTGEKTNATDGISNYINGGNVTVLVVQKNKRAKGQDSHIETDYVKLVIIPE
jgi:parallel beta-helix repeat protein